MVMAPDPNRSGSEFAEAVVISLPPSITTLLTPEIVMIPAFPNPWPSALTTVPPVRRTS